MRSKLAGPLRLPPPDEELHGTRSNHCGSRPSTHPLGSRCRTSWKQWLQVHIIIRICVGNFGHACVGHGARMLQFRNCTGAASRTLRLSMNSKRLHKHWRKDLKERVKTARRLLRKDHPLSVKEVHDLRVALRRARLLAGLGSHSLINREAENFRARTRTLLDLVSSIRDCDVALDWLRKTKSPAQVVAKLSLRRKRLWQARRHRIQSSKSEINIRLKSKAHARRLEQRLKKKIAGAVQDCQALVKDPRKLSVTGLHSLRRVIRRWRYLRELLLESQKQSGDARLRTLIKVQDSLGELQNTEAILNQLKPLGHMQELSKVRSRLEDNFIRQRHKALRGLKSLPASE